jgi:general secretion pathway protein K
MKMRVHRSAEMRGGERGFVIVPVLWILLTLAGLAGVLAAYLSNSAAALSLNDDRLRIAALATAGLELTAYKVSLQEKKLRPASGNFEFRLDRSRARVSFSSESSRIDLNFASNEMLANLFKQFGADLRDATQYADRIVGWRTPPKNESLESETALYRAAGAQYAPRGEPFANVQELWLVLGLPPAMVERMMQFVTVFSGQNEVDVLDAAPEVVAALPGMTPAALENFLKQREGLPRDVKSISDALGLASANVAVESSDSLRVRISIELDNGRRSFIEAVILLGKGDDPYKVLSWSDAAEKGGSRGLAARTLR